MMVSAALKRQAERSMDLGMAPKAIRSASAVVLGAIAAWMLVSAAGASAGLRPAAGRRWPA